MIDLSTSANVPGFVIALLISPHWLPFVFGFCWITIRVWPTFIQ